MPAAPSTISTYLKHAVILGSGGEHGPLSITSSGEINPQGVYGVTGLTLPAGVINPTVINSGMIYGAIGYGSPSSVGGIGVYVGAGLKTALIDNYNLIAGAAGGYGSSSDGGTGGTGIVLLAGTIINKTAGTISGGYGGNNYYMSAGGNGGVGATLASGSYLKNAGYIYGGYGGSGSTGGVGGTGVAITQAVAVNENGSSIYGGAAGSSAAGYTGSNGGAGVYLDGGTLINAGNVIGGVGAANGGTGGTGIVIVSGVVNNSGDVLGGNGSNGTLVGGVGGVGVYVESGTLVTSGGIGGGTGGLAGAINAPSGDAVVFGSGAATLVVDPGAYFTGAVVANAAAADVLDLAGSTPSYLGGVGTQIIHFNQINLEQGAAWTLAGNAAGLASSETITGFTLGDTIVLTGFAASSDSYVTGTGLVLSNATGSETLDLTGNFSTGSFLVNGDATTDTTDIVACFAAGTKITTARGDVAVESLQIGDRVKTLHAGLQKIKFIGRRSYAAPFANHKKILPICIRANALADGVPARDLYVSPGHALCVDDALMHADLLVNGVSIFQLSQVETITYFHIEFETHQVVFAENCPAESFMGEEFRNLFENASEFSRLYPGHAAPGRACLPILAGGFELLDIVRRIAARAGVTAPAARPPGKLRGYVDRIIGGQVAGWAQDEASPEEPVLLEVICGLHVQRVLANSYRGDLRDAGLGSGCHGFMLELPPELTGQVEIRRAADGEMLETGAGALARAA